MSTKLVRLDQTSQGCPEQWEGETEDGQQVDVRERGGLVRISVDGHEIYEETLGDRQVYEVIAEHFYDASPRR